MSHTQDIYTYPTADVGDYLAVKPHRTLLHLNTEMMLKCIGIIYENLRNIGYPNLPLYDQEMLMISIRQYWKDNGSTGSFGPVNSDWLYSAAYWSRDILLNLDYELLPYKEQFDFLSGIIKFYEHAPTA